MSRIRNLIWSLSIAGCLLAVPTGCSTPEPTPEPLAAVRLEWEPVWGLVANPDGDRMAFVGSTPSRAVGLWDLEGEPTLLPDNGETPRSIAEYSPTAIYVDNFGAIWRYDLEKATYERVDAATGLLRPLLVSPGRYVGKMGRSVVEWETLDNAEFKVLLGEQTWENFRGSPMSYSADYALVNQHLFPNPSSIEERLEGSAVGAWKLDENGATSPSSSYAIEGSIVEVAAFSLDGRALIVSTDLLHVWNIETGEIQVVENIGASWRVFVLENGIIVTSGVTDASEAEYNYTRFWDPNTLEEIRTVKDMRLQDTVSLSDGRVAFSFMAFDEFRGGEEGDLTYWLEVWDLDQIDTRED